MGGLVNTPGRANKQEYVTSKYKSLDKAKAKSNKSYTSGGPKGAVKIVDSGKQLGISYDNLTGLYKDQGAMGQYYNDLYSGKYDEMAGKERRTTSISASEYGNQPYDEFGDGSDTYTKTENPAYADYQGDKAGAPEQYNYTKTEDYYYNLGYRGKEEAAAAGVEDRTGMGSAVKLADSGQTVKASDAGATQSRPAGREGTIKKINNIQI